MISKHFLKLLHSPFFTYQSLYATSLAGRFLASKKERRDHKDDHHKKEYYHSRGTGHYASLLPLFAILAHKLNTASCTIDPHDHHNLKRDRLAERVESIQYPSNHPIEDRWVVSDLESISGYVAIVLDGHGGWQVAEFARQRLAKEIDEALKNNKKKSFASEEEYIKASLKEAFDKVENDFIKKIKEAFDIGFANTGRVGACALVALVTGNKLYAANAGDCKGVVCKNENGKVTVRKINSKLNANSKKEQKRLKEQFTDEDIFYCKNGDQKACYVKKRLQPTRAFGDLHLKHQEFNNPKGYGLEYGFRPRLEVFNGPYITHEPSIQVFNLEKDDKYLILSTDGMWDELNKNDVARLAEQNLGDKQKLTTDLLHNAIKTAAAREKMTEEEIRNVPAGGKRRDLHDDMTILVVDLENQGK